MSFPLPYNRSDHRTGSPVHRHPISDSDFEFPQKTIEQAARRGQLLSMEIEFSLRCNFRCPYCYVPHDSQLKNELTADEIESAVLQAKALGADGRGEHTAPLGLDVGQVDAILGPLGSGHPGVSMAPYSTTSRPVFLNIRLTLVM